MIYSKCELCLEDLEVITPASVIHVLTGSYALSSAVKILFIVTISACTMPDIRVKKEGGELPLCQHMEVPTMKYPGLKEIRSCSSLH